MADGPVTIADVAAAAGVSVATVSKVINDRYGVAEQTSARVREVIEQLGYTSSLVAQSLRSRRSNVIGVIASDIEPFNAELLKGAARGLRGTGYDLIVFSDCGRYEDQAGWEQRSLARVSALTDGSVLVTPSSVDVTSSRPLVAVDHNVRSTTLPTVDSDNLSGGVTATEYLIGLGHRRIGSAREHARHLGERRVLEDRHVDGVHRHRDRHRQRRERLPDLGRLRRRLQREGVELPDLAADERPGHRAAVRQGRMQLRVGTDPDRRQRLRDGSVFAERDRGRHDDDQLFDRPRQDAAHSVHQGRSGGEAQHSLLGQPVDASDLDEDGTVQSQHGRVALELRRRRDEG